MNLFLVEVRRCLSRRLVWALVAIAFVGIVVTGVIAFANAARTTPGPAPMSVCEMRVLTPGQPPVEECTMVTGMVEPFTLTDLWPLEDEGDPALAASVFFLAIGGLLAGASMIGAEWRAGTMTTVLTWEPRRVRLALAKFAAVIALAWSIAMALQVLLVLAVVPAAVVHGSTEGVGGEWLRVLAGAVVRSGGVTAMAAVFGAAIAMVGRNTAAAFGAAFAYMVIGENLVRGWKPWLRPWLLAENSVVVLTAEPLNDPVVGRGVSAAMLTLLVYSVALVALAVASFRLRDVAST